MAEDTPEVNKGQPSLSRRDFLKLAGVGVGAALLSQTKPGREITSLITGPNTEWISSEIPPELISKEIPAKNEFYRQPLAILNEGISLYESWRKNDGSLPEISYTKPPNFLDVSRTADLLVKGNHQFDYFLDELLSNDRPDYAFIDFSMGGIRSFDYMVVTNPGTGLIRQIKEGYKSNFGTEFNLSTDDQEQYLATNCLKWFGDAKKFIDREVDKKGKQSTSLLFAYFLHKNKGNLNESMWDTVLWLKIAGRNDLETWEQKPTRQGAELLTNMFKDEFSLKISANWVLENVSPDSVLLNSPEKYANMQFKDFITINRAGSFSHPWNIIALSTSMSPFVLERFVHAHHSYMAETEYHGKNSLSPDGREKASADLEVSTYADQLSKLVQSYRKEH